VSAKQPKILRQLPCRARCPLAQFQASAAAHGKTCLNKTKNGSDCNKQLGGHKVRYLSLFYLLLHVPPPPPSPLTLPRSSVMTMSVTMTKAAFALPLQLPQLSSCQIVAGMPRRLVLRLIAVESTMPWGRLAVSDS
jgi:hypothetical protein